MSDVASRVAEVTRRGRARAEARMVSTATVRRKTGATVQDEESGREVPVWTTVVTDSPFRLKGTTGASASQTVNIGGVEVTLALREGHFPDATESLRDADLIDITGGENAGTVWRIVDSSRADQQTAYRVPVVAADRPEEWS